jgi:hypothetical protein
MKPLPLPSRYCSASGSLAHPASAMTDAAASASAPVE